MEHSRRLSKKCTRAYPKNCLDNYFECAELFIVLGLCGWSCSMKTKLFGLLAALAFAVPANASMLEFQATLLGTNEAPPNASTATGFIDVTLDDATDMLTVHETFSGLTGGPASVAHIHCCTPITSPPVALPVVLPFTGFPNLTSGTYDHTFDLTASGVLINGMTAPVFISNLEAGLTYANIHNATFPGGE